MGLIVPKFHHSAVARNRLRRRLKEIWRTDMQHDQGSFDLLIRARPDAYQAPFATLKRELLHWRDAVRTAQ
jgi:ribonuclease P protein component